MVFFDGTKPKLTGLRKDEKETLAGVLSDNPSATSCNPSRNPLQSLPNRQKVLWSCRRLSLMKYVPLSTGT